MAERRQWHTFRCPGLSGIRGTLVVLIVLTIVIVGPILRHEPQVRKEQASKTVGNSTAYFTAIDQVTSLRNQKDKQLLSTLALPRPRHKQAATTQSESPCLTMYAGITLE